MFVLLTRQRGALSPFFARVEGLYKLMHESPAPICLGPSDLKNRGHVRFKFHYELVLESRRLHQDGPSRGSGSDLD